MASEDGYRLSYREFRPPDNLKHRLRGGWQLSVDTLPAETYNHRVVPEPTSSVVCMRIEKGWQLIGMGPHLHAMEIPVRQGSLYTGVRFLPGVAQSLFDIDAAAHVGARGRLGDIMPTLDEALTGGTGILPARSAEEIRQYIQHVMGECFAAAPGPDDRVLKAARLIRQHKGDIRLREVAESVFLSERQLRRIMTQATGLNPKQMMRMARLRAAAETALHEGQGSWRRVAAEHGYSDQAHLSRDIRELTGISPSGLDEAVRRIDHQDLID